MDSDTDWANVFEQLEELAITRLDNRSGAVMAILRKAAPTEDAFRTAVERVRVLQIPFVDPLRLSYLAEEMEVVIDVAVGREPVRHGFQDRTGLSLPGDNATGWAVAGCGSVAILSVVVCLALVVEGVTSG